MAKQIIYKTKVFKNIKNPRTGQKTKKVVGSKQVKKGVVTDKLQLKDNANARLHNTIRTGLTNATATIGEIMTPHIAGSIQNVNGGLSGMAPVARDGDDSSGSTPNVQTEEDKQG